MTILLHIHQWICQWTNFENQSTFGKVMDNIIVDCFLTHSVHLLRYLTTLLVPDPATQLPSVTSSAACQSHGSLGQYSSSSTPLIWRRLLQTIACRYTSMLTIARYTAPVSLTLLRRCQIQCHNVSTASLSRCARITSNSMPIKRKWCGARPLVSCRNYPAVRSLLLVHLFVL